MARPVLAKAAARQEFGGGGTPEAVPLSAGCYGARSEGGQKFLPPNPFPFCPPELKSFSKFSVRIFAKKSPTYAEASDGQVGFRSGFGAKLYVASLLPRRFAPRQADCIVFAKIFWVQSPPFAKAKRGSLRQGRR
ncbi:MAG: hypothetical protein Q8N88_04495 [Nanoarchaeota archaeon]|nr:hypothetical protein [Nanoarchaeota archaeon]